MSQQPNILYVFADQFRASALGCMNAEAVRTPHLDQLASQGVLFRHAIANTPVCTPSRAELLTGRHALTCRCIANDMRLPEDERTIAHVCQDHGYSTGYIGKWHLDGISRHMHTPPGPRRHGFDDYWAAYNCSHAYLDCRYYQDASPELIRSPGYEPDIQTDLAIDFIRQRGAEPFCLFLSWGPPHAPYRDVPGEFLSLYPPSQITLRPDCLGADRAAIAGYYAHITALDRNIGRLMAALDEEGLAEETIVVFSSDHGDMLWSHGQTKKQLPWEESIHVPLIIRWPAGLPGGRTSDLLIGIVDYTPTLIGLAGMPVPPAMDGLDLSAALVDETRAPTSAFIANYIPFDQALDTQPWRGVRTKRYTYARWLQGGAVLYDNAQDPYQLHNLSAQPGNDRLEAKLESELQTWLTRLRDSFLPGTEHIRQLGQEEEWLVREEHFHGTINANF
jgi:arylsulfatase A-like enzyme